MGRGRRVLIALVGEVPGSVDDAVVQRRKRLEETLREIEAAVARATGALKIRTCERAILCEQARLHTSSMIVAWTVLPL